MEPPEDTSFNVESLLIDLAYNIHHGVECELEEKFDNKDLNNKQLTALISISEHKCATSAAIARHLGLPQSHMTMLLDSLEANAYISRVCDLQDRHSITLKLLSKGREVVNASIPILSSLPQSLMSSLTQEEKESLEIFLQNFPEDS